VGTKWRDWSKKPTTSNKQAVLDAAKSYFRHPSRCNWMDEIVKQWARQHPDQVKQASDGILQKGWDGARQGAYQGAKKIQAEISPKSTQAEVEESSKTVLKGLDMMNGGKK
jgi:hypothetical protein